MMLSTINPYTEEIIASYSWNTWQEVQSIISQTAHAQQQWRGLSVHERCAIVREIFSTDNWKNNLSENATLITKEMGKPISQAVAEIQKSATVVEYYLQHAEQYLASEEVALDGTSVAHIKLQPLGIVLAIMPWNFPLWQAVRFAVPAILAGNAVLLKHAPNTTGCAYKLVELFTAWGFPENLFRCVVVDLPLVEDIIAHNDVQAITFTGSTKGGRSVAMLAGKYGKKSVLELGGSDPYIVTEHANLEQAVKACVTSRMNNAGQSCVAAKRFIVHTSLYDAFIEQALAQMNTWILGDPLEQTTTIGPLARKDLKEGLELQVQRCIAQGALYRASRHVLPQTGYFVQPALLTEVTPNMLAFTEELFGPVASVTPFTTDTEALEIANASEYGLGAAVFSENPAQAEWFASRIASGMIAINDFVRSDARYPFGGVKSSGYGRELAQQGLREFVTTKTTIRL